MKQFYGCMVFLHKFIRPDPCGDRQFNLKQAFGVYYRWCNERDFNPVNPGLISEQHTAYLSVAGMIYGNFNLKYNCNYQ